MDLLNNFGKRSIWIYLWNIL